MIQFAEAICADVETASEREWLETNGLGGFASSTITGLNTRRYHGLLMAATRPPVGRLLLLAKLEETLVIDGQGFDLSANQYADTVHPRGFQYLKGFRLDPFPIFTYEVSGLQITKSIFMVEGENSTVIQYEMRLAESSASCNPAATDCRLEIRPLIAFRDYHGTTHENAALNPAIDRQDRLISFTPYPGLPTLHLAHQAQAVESSGHWYRNFAYRVERQRGLDFQEDLFNPCVLKFDLADGGRASLIASTEIKDVHQADRYRADEISRRQRLAAVAPVDNELVVQLSRAARQFIVARGQQKTVIAGYHWFSDWGRDTMIALPGLMYAMPSTEAAKRILLAFAEYADQGMLPNRFPDADEDPEYNTIDATLWFFEAIRALAERTGDYEFIRTRLYDTLVGIIKWHVRGTRYGIKVGEDGLISGGIEGVQLTWMDAKVGDYVVTPRHGKPVEIQALWYNALRVMQGFAGRFHDPANETLYGEMAETAKKNFSRQFWNEESDCLYDVIHNEGKDGAIRPNQILAVSLPHTMLSRERARRVVAVVERELLTPFGLRSLAPGDARYRPVYTGDTYSRDTAYHQGTVWAWLMGPFITAYVKVNQQSKKSRQTGAALLEGFREHLREAGLGTVSEIFDAEAPHRPGGCIAQAWSVAELLRAACEDVFVNEPVSARKAQV